ncbi:hypothetical protein [Streptomyces sp. B21-083]|uniref:hypothetical protein n=1 Tax=Streptomyces sp. B21-083 TaxID=3039410 RepID=UPI002FF2782C
MALDYPYVALTGQSEEGAVEVRVAVLDEYHLVDEVVLLQAVRDQIAARPGITSVDADRYEVRVTPVPEA